MAKQCPKCGVRNLGWLRGFLSSVCPACASAEQARSAEFARLAKQLQDGSHQEKAHAAMELGKLGELNAVPLLIATIEKYHYETSVCNAVVAALGTIGKPALEDVTKRLADSHDSARRVFTAAVAQIADSASVHVLLRCLSDSDLDVRMVASAGLGRIGDARAIDPLARLAQDKTSPYPSGRSAALRALGAIGGDRARDVVERIAGGDDVYLVDLAAQILGDRFGVLTEKEKRRRQEEANRLLPSAAANGQIENVEKMLADGVPVDTQDGQSYSALHWAACRGHSNIAALLVAKGANPNLVTSSGATPLHLAATTEMVSPAPVDGRRKVIEQLVAAGADVKMRNAQGATPLHHAAEGGPIEIAKALVAAGAPVNVTCNIGRTPLYMAVLRARSDVAALLLDEAADVNQRALDDFTPLGRALNSGFEELASLLRQRGGVE